MRKPALDATPWKCYARPAALGRTCGHFNATGGMRAGTPWNPMRTCESCGCTDIASRAREPKEAA
jgi:hypothetical protein